jgi:protease II
MVLAAAPLVLPQERLYQEMRGRIKEEDASVPERLHGWGEEGARGDGKQDRHPQSMDWRLPCRLSCMVVPKLANSRGVH